MGHQTNYKECDKCKGVTITTIAFGKTIKTSNCKCKKKRIMKRETIEQVVVLVIAVSAFILSGLVR